MLSPCPQEGEGESVDLHTLHICTGLMPAFSPLVLPIVMSLAPTDSEIANLLMVYALAPICPTLATYSTPFRILVDMVRQLTFIVPSLTISLPPICLTTPLSLRLADSSLAVYLITHYVWVPFHFADMGLSDTIEAYISQLGHYQAILS